MRGRVHVLGLLAAGFAISSAVAAEQDKITAATVTQPGGKSQTVSLTPQAFGQLVQGPHGQFDSVIEKGLPNVLTKFMQRNGLTADQVKPDTSTTTPASLAQIMAPEVATAYAQAHADEQLPIPSLGSGLPPRRSHNVIEKGLPNTISQIVSAPVQQAYSRATGAPPASPTVDKLMQAGGLNSKDMGGQQGNVDGPDKPYKVDPLGYDPQLVARSRAMFPFVSQNTQRLEWMQEQENIERDRQQGNSYSVHIN